ncbi:hypothetical protein [Roseburia sp. 1XD42-69]|uniref:hypothetical protein n=1 Tax=Roseburia sp. 1XD42-69 TaxID=2320088 RepID=UPI000EA161C5|nr:hypothetical protein [Roseburia sp. 1XD42-69]RKJ62068.1 hypothetical protein D7Y06_18375 [Roseburia sp. 1XD42-69]
MSDKFTVINSTDVDKNKETARVYRVARIGELWERYFFDMVMRYTKEYGTLYKLPQDKLAKVGLVGIKYICSCRDVSRENFKLGIDEPKTLKQNQYCFQMIDSIFGVLGCLTLRNFVTTFPVDKYYKGAKWQEKDYFSTMEVLSKMDWDKPIGRNELSELLWDYYNADLRHAYMEYTTAMSAIYKAQTGKGIMERFFEDRGVPVYTMDKETGIMINNQTGDIMKPKKASHIQIVK